MPSAAELRRLMSGVEVTVYLDNADLSAEQLRLLADSAPDATFVLASHIRSLLGQDSVGIQLKGLDRDAGMELLARELGELPPEESAAADTLWQTTQGRPLLLLRAAALARPSGTASVRLPRPAEVEDLIPLLLDQMSASQTTVLHLLATLDADLKASTISSITGTPKVLGLCEHLVRLGLVIADNDGYRCAADVIPVIEQRIPKPFSIEQICRHFISWTERSATTPEQVAARSRALERAVELASAEGRAALAVRLARAASPKLARSLQHDAWSRMLGLGWRPQRPRATRTPRPTSYTRKASETCFAAGTLSPRFSSAKRSSLGCDWATAMVSMPPRMPAGSCRRLLHPPCPPPPCPPTRRGECPQRDAIGHDPHGEPVDRPAASRIHGTRPRRPGSGTGPHDPPVTCRYHQARQHPGRPQCHGETDGRGGEDDPGREQRPGGTRGGRDLRRSGRQGHRRDRRHGDGDLQQDRRDPPRTSPVETIRD